MTRARIPSARSVRRAVDLLAQLSAEVLGQLAEAFIDRLDAAEPDPDLEEDEDACQAEDAPMPEGLALGDDDDAEPECDDEEDDPQGDGREDADMPVFPLRRTEMRPERDGLVTVRRRLREIVVVKSIAGRPTGVATMWVRRFP